MQPVSYSRRLIAVRGQFFLGHEYLQLLERPSSPREAQGPPRGRIWRTSFSWGFPGFIRGSRGISSNSGPTGWDPNKYAGTGRGNSNDIQRARPGG
eukprot:353953-Amorphochlora_amoeboformis.AAC.2